MAGRTRGKIIKFKLRPTQAEIKPGETARIISLSAAQRRLRKAAEAGFGDVPMLRDNYYPFFNLARLIREGHVEDFILGPAATNIELDKLERIALKKVRVYGIWEGPVPKRVPKDKHIMTLIMKGAATPQDRELHIYADKGRKGPGIEYVPSRSEDIKAAREERNAKKLAYREMAALAGQRRRRLRKREGKWVSE